MCTITKLNTLINDIGLSAYMTEYTTTMISAIAFAGICTLSDYFPPKLNEYDAFGRVVKTASCHMWMDK